MEPFRILQVVTIMNRGGLETMLMNYYRQMERTKIQFDFMVHRYEKGDYDEEIFNLGGKIFRMPQIRPGNYATYFNKLDDFFRSHPEYKVVHSHINENSSFVLRAAKRAGVPGRIAHSHLSDLGIDIKLPFRLYARYYMKDQPSDYFACSKKAGEWLFGKEMNSKEVTVLNNAVNIEEFKYNAEIRKKIRNELGVENQLVIGHIGRFNKQKNHEYIIEVFKEVQSKKSDSILLLCGEGNLRHVIEKKVHNLGLSSNVLFLGVRNDIPQIMQGMDIFLFPSLFEGLPVVLIEAQAAGLKCLVSNTITEESDITGRLDFISLQEHPSVWSDKILCSTYDHVDTTENLRRYNYDTVTMTKWLSKYYEEYYLSGVK